MTNRYEKLLVLLLRLDALLLLTALVPSMMPFAWMQEIHQFLGMGELPEGPLIGYLTRSLSMLYAMHGAVIFFVSRDVRRFLPIVKFMVALGVFFGLWMTGLDIVVGMPAVLDRLRRTVHFPWVRRRALADVATVGNALCGVDGQGTAVYFAPAHNHNGTSASNFQPRFARNSPGSWNSCLAFCTKWDKRVPFSRSAAVFTKPVGTQVFTKGHGAQQANREKNVA